MATAKPLAVVSPTDTEMTRIAAEASRGSDLFLPARDRRSRAQISARTSIAAGSAVRVKAQPGDTFRLVGPGRGDGWALLAWRDAGSDCFGTYHETQLELP